MSIYRRPDGTIYADTPAEMHAFLVMLEGGAPQPVAPQSGLGSLTPETRYRWSSMLVALTPAMTHALQVIADHPAGITTTKLMAKLGIDRPESLSGILSGLSKNITKYGLRPDDVFARISRGYGASRVITYRPGPLMRPGGAPP